MNDGSGSSNGVRFGITEAAHHGDERTTLLGVLQRQRDLIAWKLRGAAEDALSAPVMPTGMTLHGIVRHLTSAERYWFRVVFAGQPGLEPDWTTDDPDADWRVPPGMSMADLLDEYTTETTLCDAVVAATTSLDAVSVERDVSLWFILLHMVEETARHLGQMDLMRELVDGMVGEEPTS